MASAAQKRVWAKLSKASKACSKAGKKGKAFRACVRSKLKKKR